jgi:hypothetical protein
VLRHFSSPSLSFPSFFRQDFFMKKVSILLVLLAALYSTAALAQAPPDVGVNSNTSASVPADNPLVFTSKAQLLQRKRLLAMLRLKSLSNADTTLLTDSLIATLRGDYNLTTWDMDRVMQNGVATTRLAAVCRSELEYQVRNLFDATLEAYRSTWSNEGPAFQRGDLAAMKSRIDSTAHQLLASKSSWCMTGSVSTQKPHLYQTTLPKLLGEFDAAIASSLEELRIRLRADYQKQQAQAAVVAKAEDDARAVSEQKQKVQAAAQEQVRVTGEKRDAALVAASKNTKPQPITPDMCIDGVCVEQAFGSLPASIQWQPRPPEPQYRIPNKREYDAFMAKVHAAERTGCEEGNRPLWGNKVGKLCDVLFYKYDVPRATIATFFRENTQAVCVPLRLTVSDLEIKTSTGLLTVEVAVANDGILRVKALQKTFDIPTSQVPELRAMLKQKHPHLEVREAFRGDPIPMPWGGKVSYSDKNPHRETEDKPPVYRLQGRSSIFGSIDSGACTRVEKAHVPLSVK